MSTADRLTLSRIPLSLALLWLTPLSPPFTAVYLLCGLTDVLDGFVARHTHTESERGARLDTAADMAFAAAWLLRVPPVLSAPRWVWYGAAAVAAVKAATLLCGFRRERRLVTAHTALNRLSGVLLWLLPLSMHLCPVRVSAGPLLALSLAAAVQERLLLRREGQSI